MPSNAHDTYKQLLLKSAKLIAPTNTSGLGRSMRSPLISVFIGAEAERCQEAVLRVYEDGWPEWRGKLPCISWHEYSPKRMKQEISHLLENATCYAAPAKVLAAYFCDINGMDDNQFNEMFDLIRGNDGLPFGYSESKLLFIFCRVTTPEDREQSHIRLDRLSTLADKQPLILLSNVRGNMGYISEDEISENYQLCGDLLLMGNSLANEGEDAHLGNQLLFDLNEPGLKSAAYVAMLKPSEQIASVTLSKILDCYLNYSRVQSRGSSIIKLFAGDDESYDDIFDTYYKTVVLPKIPRDLSFLSSLPYTREMHELDDALRRTESRKKNVGCSIGSLLVSAVESLRSHDGRNGWWDLCFNKYFANAVIENDCCIDDYLSSAISSRLTYKDMASGLDDLIRDLEAYQGDMDVDKSHDFTSKILSETKNSEDSLSACLGWYAKKELRQCTYARLAEKLVTLLKQLKSIVTQFPETVQVAQQCISNSLSRQPDDVTKDAYGILTSEICNEHYSAIYDQFLPCFGDDLPGQLSRAYQKVIEFNPQYEGTLQQYLNLVSGQGAHHDAVADCFNQDLSQVPRLPLLNPPDRMSRKYCLVPPGGAFTQYIDFEGHGKVFNSFRTDKIERLLIFDVDPRKIIW